MKKETKVSLVKSCIEDYLDAYMVSQTMKQKLEYNRRTHEFITFMLRDCPEEIYHVINYYEDEKEKRTKKTKCFLFN